MKRSAPFVTLVIALALALPAAPGLSTQARMVNSLAPLSPADVEATWRVSVASDGTQGNDDSGEPSISADGRFVAFVSEASNLVAGDTNGFWDIFVQDRTTGQISRISVASNGPEGNGVSYDPSISADGRFVAFRSLASNLCWDTNGASDIFVHDRTTRQTWRVSVASDGTQANDHSFHNSISADGRYVAFQSWATNLVSGDTNSSWDVFVHDNLTNQTMRVSVDSNGAQGNGFSDNPSISADGRYVAFDSTAANLVGGDTNGLMDIFVYDRTTGQTQLVSVDSSGAHGNGQSGEPSISADGRYVAFGSGASNLVGGDTNGADDIFVHDRTTGQTRRVSVDSNGAQANVHSRDSSISADGRFIAYESYASNLVSGDTNGDWDIFVHDTTTGQTRRVSVASDGTQGNNESYDPSISSNGRFVAYESYASTLVSGDTNGAGDVFVHEWTFYGLVVAPPADARSGPPGGTVSYSLNVTNNGNIGDTFNVAVSGNAWTTSTPATIGPITPGASQSMNVSVTIPSSAAGGSTDTATLTVTSQGDNTKQDGAVLTTTANTGYGVDIEPPTDNRSGNPGATVNYTLQVNNTGNLADTFNVVVSGHSWTTSAPATIGPIAPGASQSMNVSVTIPSSAAGGSTDTATVTIISQGDNSKSDSSALTTTANTAFGVTVSPYSQDGSAAPGTTMNYSLTVTNNGNATDTFNVAVSGNTWTTNAPATLGPIPRGASQSLIVSVSIPSSAAGGSWDVATVTVTSQGDNTKSGSAELHTTASLVFGVAIDPAADFKSGAPGSTVIYSLNVTNLSNFPFTFDVALSGNAWTMVAPADLGPIAPGLSQAMNVSVTIPAFAASGSTDVATVTVTAQGEETNTASATLTTTASSFFDVTVSPSSDARRGAPGTTVTYSLAVTNNGNAPDSFHTSVSGNLWTTTAPATFGPLAPGDTVFVDVNVTIPASAANGSTDSATVTITSQGDPSRSGSAILTTSASNGVNISPHMAARSGAPGTTVIYSLTVTNNSSVSDTYDVIVDDNAWTTSAPATIGPIAAGASRALNVSVTIPASAARTDADLEVSLSAAPNPVTIGKNLTYTIVVSNHGPLNATHVVLTDHLPAGTAYVSNDSGCTHAAGLVTCSLGALANGSSKTIHIVVRVTAVGSLIDTASVTGDQADPSPGNNSASATTQAIYRKVYLPMIRR